MQCARPLAVDAASTPSPLTASDRATETLNGEQSGPAATTEMQRTCGIDVSIEKRAARLRHSNLIRRARYIRLHQILSKREGRA